MSDIFNELKEISELIGSSALLDMVRREVRAAVKDALVMDGKHSSQGRRYRVVVTRTSEKADVVARRLRANIPNIQVDELVDGVIGIRTSRRGKL